MAVTVVLVRAIVFKITQPRNSLNGRRQSVQAMADSGFECYLQYERNKALSIRTLGLNLEGTAHLGKLWTL